MIGDEIKAMRLLRNLTQEDLANKLDVSVDFIRSIEQGRRNPSYKLLEKISILFGKKIELKDLNEKLDS